MITIAWYNVVAIIVGIIALGLLGKASDGSGPAAGFGLVLWLISVVLFYSIWGGIFWW